MRFRWWLLLVLLIIGASGVSVWRGWISAAAAVEPLGAAGREGRTEPADPLQVDALAR